MARKRETDLELAREIVERFAARACFHAQQCSGFALKGALIALADDHPRTHVGEGLLRELEALDVAIPEDVLPRPIGWICFTSGPAIRIR